MGKKDGELTNIECSEIIKTYHIKDQDIRIKIQKVKTAEYNGDRIILDEEIINNMLDGILRSVKNSRTSYVPLPTEIIIRNDFCQLSDNKNDDKTVSKDNSGSESKDIFESYEPRFSITDVVINEEVRKQINTALSAVKNRVKLSEEWGMSKYLSGNRAIILNFYGKAGTGKSMTAEAIAKELGKKVYKINYSELESKYVGETPKNIRRAFANATRDDAVLIFDEADSFLGKRLTSVTQSADYGVNITRSVLLMELEKFSGIVIFTTNLISNYDNAFKRRILLNVYFEMPDKDAREMIWRLHIGEKMPLDKAVTTELLAERYDNISGADIKDIIFFAALHTLEQEKECIDIEMFDYAYRSILERYKNEDDQVKREYTVESITEEQYRKETGRG